MFRSLVLVSSLFISSLGFSSNWNLHRDIKVSTPEGQRTAGELVEGSVINAKDEYGVHTAEVLNVIHTESEGLPLVSFELLDFESLNAEGEWVNHDILAVKAASVANSGSSLRLGKTANLLIVPALVAATMVQGADAGPLTAAALCPGFCTTLSAYGCNPVTIPMMISLLAPATGPAAPMLVTSFCGALATGGTVVCLDGCFLTVTAILACP